MFGSNIITRAITIPKILSGINNVLNIANKAIPLYKQVKPAVINSYNFIGNISSKVNNVSKNNTNLTSHKLTVSNPKHKKNIDSLPIFFQ